MNGPQKILLFIILLTALIIAGFYILTSDKNSVHKNSSGQATLDISDWKTYRNDTYYYTARYPTSGWLITKNIRDGIIPGSLQSVNLYTQRSGNAEVDELSTTITFSVYEVPDLSLSKWLYNEIPDLTKSQQGDMSGALQEANNNKTGILNHTDSIADNLEISRFGAVIDPGYFTYATYLHNVGSSRIYSIELVLPLRYKDQSADPDNKYTDVYNTVVSSFARIK